MHDFLLEIALAMNLFPHNLLNLTKNYENINLYRSIYENQTKY